MNDTAKIIPHEAIKYISKKKLKTSYDWSELYAKEHNSAFTIAKIMELDVLNSIHKQVIKAVEEGQSFHSFKKDILKKLGESGWGKYKQIDEKTGKEITRLSDKRLKKIYDTNKRQSFHAGNWQRFQENKKRRPYLCYRLGSSKHHRKEHVQFNGLVLPVDDPFWLTHAPMNGWGCKCWLQSLTKEKAEDKGISESPNIEYHEWENKKTGEKKLVPKGIDPSFEYNVGVHREEMLKNTLATKIIDTYNTNPQMAMRFVEEIISKHVSTVTFKNITPNRVAVTRLAIDDNGIKEHEGIVADEWQQYYNVRLERFDKNSHKILVDGKDADFVIVDKSKASNEWLTVDFMFTDFTFDRRKAEFFAYSIISHRRSGRNWRMLQEQINNHLRKADIVPIDLRGMTVEMRTKILLYVLSLSKEQQEKIVLIK